MLKRIDSDSEYDSSFIDDRPSSEISKSSPSSSVGEVSTDSELESNIVRSEIRI